MQALTRRFMVVGAAMLAALVAIPAGAQDAPAKPVTIEFFGLASHNWPLVIERFQADYPTVTLHFTKFGTDELKQALRVGASSGKLPDAWWNWGGSLASPYNRAGHALKLTPEMLAALGVEANVTPAALDITRDGADLYGIPNKIGPFGFVYKKALFDKYGLQPPQSFAELEKVAETLKANGVTPFSIGGKFSWMTMRFFDFFLEHYAGPEGHDALLDMTESWESEPVIQSFAKLKEWADKELFPGRVPDRRPGHQHAAALQRPGGDGVRHAEPGDRPHPARGQVPGRLRHLPAADRPDAEAGAGVAVADPGQCQGLRRRAQGRAALRQLCRAAGGRAGHGAGGRLPERDQGHPAGRRPADPAAMVDLDPGRDRLLPADRPGPAAGRRRRLFRGAGSRCCWT